VALPASHGAHRASAGRRPRVSVELARPSHSVERRGGDMLFLVFLCLILWFLGVMTTNTLGGVLHILLVVAIIFLLIHIIQGRSIGNA
jgi:hypothetical protein